MNHPHRSGRARAWRRLTVRAVVIGALGTMVVGSAASAAEPYPPDEIDGVLCGSNDDPVANDCNDDPGGDNGSSTVPEHPSGDDDECSTTYDEDLDTDVLKLLDPGIDFGDDTWAVGAPLGVGSVQWSVECGRYTADITGTLHLVDGHSGRIHVDFINSDGVEATKHSRIRTAPANGHDSWSVNLSSPAGVHIVQVRVCTEISDDGVDFDAVTCKTRDMGS